MSAFNFRTSSAQLFTGRNQSSSSGETVETHLDSDEEESVRSDVYQGNSGYPFPPPAAYPLIPAEAPRALATTPNFFLPNGFGPRDNDGARRDKRQSGIRPHLEPAPPIPFSEPPRRSTRPSVSSTQESAAVRKGRNEGGYQESHTVAAEVRDLYGRLKKHVSRSRCPKGAGQFTLSAFSLFLSLLAISLVVMLLIGVLSIEMPNSRSYCVPGEDLFNMEDNLALSVGMTLVKQEGKLMYCADNDEQMTALLLAVLRKKQMPLPASSQAQTQAETEVESPRPEPVAFAHVLLVGEENLSSEDSRLRLLQIKTKNMDDRQLQRGVTVTSESIQIKHPGIYYVYSNLYVKLRGSKNKTETCSLLLKVKDKLLLRSVLSTNSSEDQRKTISVGGLVRLTKGSYLTAQVDCKEWYVVLGEMENSNFGLYMVTPEENVAAFKEANERSSLGKRRRRSFRNH
ncbi:uncharacterized protein LOC101854405 [Aplysia californica]|uniref:Uncharacterized protein LOC101854405 n=1 Tax=Aplysia californica TaxID=6500 RepID=A0ABM0ZY00_APLCA|nr:uncharacterized protein LOC101854405 [Aplysia californica]